MQTAAKPLPRSWKDITPAEALYVDVKGDGNCFYYCILSFLLGTKVEDAEILKIFKSHLSKIILSHCDLLIKDTNIITFSHMSSENCCELYNSEEGEKYHNNTFCALKNSQKGTLTAKDINEYVKAIEEPYTWAEQDIMSIIAGFTGLTIFTCEGPVTKKNPVSWCCHLSKGVKGFKKPIPGAEILLKYINKNHFQILVPKYIEDIPSTVPPYKVSKKTESIETITCDSPPRKKPRIYTNAKPSMKFKIFEYVERESKATMETSDKNSDNESKLNSTSEHSQESIETKTNTTSDNSDACSESQGNKKTPENSNVNYNSKSTNERDSKTEKKLVEKNSQSTSSNNDITDGFFNKARSIDDLIDLGFEYCEIKKGFSCNLCTKYLADPSEPKMNIKYEGPRSFGDKRKT